MVNLRSADYYHPPAKPPAKPPARPPAPPTPTAPPRTERSRGAFEPASPARWQAPSPPPHAAGVTTSDRLLAQQTPLDLLRGPENPRQADGPDAAARAALAGFQGERGELFESVAAPSDAGFDDLIERGSIRGDEGSQTRYFETEAHPGDGVIVTELVIFEEASGPLAGDDRAITDHPLGETLPLDASRVLVVIDRESGRGVVHVSPSETSIPIVPHAEPVLDGRGGWPIDVRLEPLHADARPIEFGERGWSDPIPNNYFEIDASADRIHIQYDAINPITAPTQGISVDGPIVLERDGDGRLRTTGENSPDLYPQVAVTQYLPDGSRESLYSERGLNVYEGATPTPIGEIFEAGRESWDEVQEAWRETFDASPGRAPFEILEGTLEVGRELGEGALQFADDLLIGGELQEGAREVRSEWDEGWREVSDADGVLDTTGETIEAAVETGYEVAEATVQTVDHVLLDGEIQEGRRRDPPRGGRGAAGDSRGRRVEQGRGGRRRRPGGRRPGRRGRGGGADLRSLLRLKGLV